MVATTQDALCPISVAQRAAELNSNIQLFERDVGTCLWPLHAQLSAANLKDMPSHCRYHFPSGFSRGRHAESGLMGYSGCCAGHFDVYLGDLFEEVSTAQAQFLVENLGAVVPVHEPAEALPIL